LIALAARILHAANEHSHGRNAGSGFAILPRIDIVKKHNAD
jgi:hypothetical protein